jgi:hypothetical protein
MPLAFGCTLLLCLSGFSRLGDENRTLDDLCVVTPDIKSSPSFVYPGLCLCDRGSFGLAPLSLLLPSMLSWDKGSVLKA